jgi:hypothetical protein
LIFVGDDWAEKHHDLCVMDEVGTVLAVARLPEGLEGLERLHALLGDNAQEPKEVVVGIETDRGIWVGALVAAGYEVYAINRPLIKTGSESSLFHRLKIETQSLQSRKLPLDGRTKLHQ